MRATRKSSGLGQDIWLDNITRDMLNDGALERCIDELCVAELASDPTSDVDRTLGSRT